MINADTIVDFAAVDHLLAFMEAYPNLAEDTIKDTFRLEIERPFLDELRFYPREAVHPFQFGSEKSRRFYFAQLRAGKIQTRGGRYVRTGTLAAGWRVDVITGDGTVVLSARNPVKYTPFVTGKRQIIGHEITGWPKHKSTIDFWREAAQERILLALHKLVNGRSR